MTVLTIRACRRYAMRMPVKLRHDGKKVTSGLLIELSQEGARISNLGRATYQAGELLTIVTPSGRELGGSIRWAHDGIAGIRLERSLYVREMSELIDFDRGQRPEAQPRYGT